jgi:hypothetical protein
MMRCRSFMCSAIRAATSGWSLQRRWVVRMGGAHGWCVAGWCASRCRSRTVAGRCRRAGPIRSRLIHRLSSVQLGLAWPSPAWTSGPDEEGRSLQCVPVREPRCRAVARTVPSCRRGRVPLDRQARPLTAGSADGRRLASLSSRTSWFHRTGRHQRGTEPNGLGRPPNVPDRGAQFLHGGAAPRMFMTGCGGRTNRRPGGMLARTAVAFDVTRGDGSSKAWSARVARVVKESRVKPGAKLNPRLMLRLKQRCNAVSGEHWR